MIEPTQWGHVVDVAVSITILIGTGAAVTWWLTRRIENRIKDEVKHMDRLQSIENRVTSVENKMDGYASKVPVFSFDKFPNVSKELGPEMKSTGESIYFIKDLNDPFFKKVYSERNLYLSR